MPDRMEMRHTRSGIGPARIEERPIPFTLAITFWAPKPAWMDYIPGPWLRFGNVWALERHLGRSFRYNL